VVLRPDGEVQPLHLLKVHRAVGHNLTCGKHVCNFLTIMCNSTSQYYLAILPFIIMCNIPHVQYYFSLLLLNTIGNLFCLLNILPIFFLRLIHCKFGHLLFYFCILLFITLSFNIVLLCLCCWYFEQLLAQEYPSGLIKFYLIFSTISWWGGLGDPVTLGAVLSGSLAPGRVSQGKVVPGEGPD